MNETLEEKRNRFIVEKLNEGHSLAEVQKMLEEELGIKMTYLDLRLLVAELQDVDWSKQDAQKEAVTPELVEPEEPKSRTRITMSRVVRPGAAMSGEVTFASGAEAEWFVDAYGRLGINPKPGSARPTEEDLREFQMELQRQLGGR